MLMAMFMPLAMFGQFRTSNSPLLTVPDQIQTAKNVHNSNSLYLGQILANSYSNKVQNDRNPYNSDGWYYYDNGTQTSAIGLGGGSFDWGVMFPAGSFYGDALSKVKVYDVKEMEGTLTIYNDGTTAPASSIGSTSVTFTGAGEFIEFDFDNLTLDPSKNVWVVFTNTSGTDYPAAASTDGTNDPNGRWVSISGNWYDCANVGVAGISWMIRAKFEMLHPAECPAPTGLAASEATAHTVQLSWTENGTAEAWQLCIDENENNLINVSETTYTLTNLNLNTEYTAKVRSVCNDYSDWSAPITFSTDLCEEEDKCEISYVLTTNSTYAAYGYDWLGATILVYDDNTGELITFWTEDSEGAGITTGTLLVCNGRNLVFVWDAGNYDDLLVDSYAIYDVNGNEITSGTGPMTNDVYYTVDCTENNCPQPNNLVVSDITTNSAALRWNGEAKSYQLVYSTVEGFDPDQASAINVEDASYTLTDLEDETTYYVYVRGVCEDSNSPWSSMVSFTTISACSAPFDVDASDITANSASISWDGWQKNYSLRYATALFFEGFEGLEENALPAGWTSIDNDGDGYEWYTMDGYADYAHSGDGVATSASYISSGALTPDNWLITPQLDLQGTMSVWLRAQDPSYPQEHYAIYLSTTGNTVNDFTVTLVAEAYDLTGEYVEITADLSAYAGQQGYIAIRHFNCSDWFRLNVDDFAIYGDWTTVNNVTNPYALTGLTEETPYAVQIQGVCESGNTDWSDAIIFTTLPLCVVPTDLDAADVTTTSAVITWTSDATSFDIEIDDVVTTGLTEASYTLNNLDPGTLYTVRVRANCGETGYSEWSDYYYFVTLCNAFDLPYEYGFEDVENNDSDLNCWWYASANSENGIGVTDYDGYVFFFSSYYQASNYAQMLISPELNTEAAVKVEFDYLPLSTQYGNETFVVGYSEDGDTFTWGEEIEADNTEDWTRFSETFPAGTKYVGIYYTSQYLTYLLFDNFSFTESTGEETETQTIDLYEGWNWVSLYVENEDGDPIALLDMLKEALGENGIEIQAYDMNTEYFDGEWFGDLDDTGITNDQMYMIMVASDCTIELTGPVADPANWPITINPGWNWIGFPFNQEVEINDAFADFPAEEGDVIQATNDQTEFDGEEFFGDIDNMIPGQGYMYFYNGDDVQTLYIQTGAKNRLTFPKMTSNKKPVKVQKIDFNQLKK